MQRLGRSLVKYVLIPILILALLSVSGVIVVTYVQKWRNTRHYAITSADGIEEQRTVPLGGDDQWIFLRGHDRSLPVLLYLHGGPGSPEAPVVRTYNSDLEEHFVVVNWDQRGAGKSFYAVSSPDQMTLEQFVSDALELTLWLKEHFDQEKIFLVGHSWGTMFGTLLAEQYPEHYYAYVGMGQAVHFGEGEILSYQYVWEQAQARNHQPALDALESIGPPPYTTGEFLTSVGIQRRWLYEFGGEVYKVRPRWQYVANVIADYLFAPEYTLRESLRILSAGGAHTEQLLEEMLALDLRVRAPQLELPVYFLVGVQDWITVHPLVQEYFDLLEAPHKELIWFERSAHSPNYEEPDRFLEVMIRILDETGPK